MKLENQVCLLEQSKRLKELGVAQQSGLLWLDYSNNPYGPKLVWFDVMVSEPGREYIYSAFSVAELGSMITDLTTIRIDGESNLWYWRSDTTGICSGRNYSTEATARAAFLIHCLSNGYVTAEEVNQRLSNS